MSRGVQQTDRGNCDMAAAIGETLSPPRTDRPFALSQTKARTSTPVEVLNVSVFDNPEGVRSSALRSPSHRVQRRETAARHTARWPLAQAICDDPLPASIDTMRAWPRATARTSLYLCPAHVCRLTPATSWRHRQTGASGEMSAAGPLGRVIVTRMGRNRSKAGSVEGCLVA